MDYFIYIVYCVQRYIHILNIEPSYYCSLFVKYKNVTDML